MYSSSIVWYAVGTFQISDFLFLIYVQVIEFYIYVYVFSLDIKDLRIGEEGREGMETAESVKRGKKEWIKTTGWRGGCWGVTAEEEEAEVTKDEEEEKVEMEEEAKVKKPCLPIERYQYLLR